MKQQLIGLQHCKCEVSWKRDIGFFERTPDMAFGLQHNAPGKKAEQDYRNQANDCKMKLDI